MKIRFLGALGRVTGSCSLVNHRDRYYLVDCGSAQTDESVGLAEGSVFPFKAAGIHAVFLTHAHFDHCGLLPVLVREGFHGKIYCTRATADLARLALMDVATLGTGGFSSSDVLKLRFVCPDQNARFQFGAFFPVDRDLTCAFIRTSHVLGSVGFEFQFSDWKETSPGQRKTIVFSGDIGCNTDENPYQTLLNGRQYPSTHAEYIVCESTYGDRERDRAHMDYWARLGTLKRLLARTASFGPGATIIFPSFTLQRAQELIVDLHCVLEILLPDDERREWIRGHGSQVSLVAEVLVDSPLAAKYGPVFVRELNRTRSNGKPFYVNTALRSRLQASIAGVDTTIVRLLCPENGTSEGRNYSLRYGSRGSSAKAAIRIVIAGAGMCNGGRVTEHLKRLLGSPKTMVALTGYQSAGTPGAELMRRTTDPSGKVDASFWGLSSSEVHADVVTLAPYYSGHADKSGLIDFIMRKNSHHPYQNVKRLFLIHGENRARVALKTSIMTRTGRQNPNDRVVEEVELPEQFSGWFDLIENDWVVEYHSTVDRADMENAALKVELKRRDEEIAELLKEQRKNLSDQERQSPTPALYCGGR
jgi:metallo-beta-lactamase family protein